MPNRTLCAVLEEMRSAHDTRNFSYLLGLIEEAQSIGNRMESALYDQSDLRSASRQLSSIKDKLREGRALLKEAGIEDEMKDRISRFLEDNDIPG